MTLLIVPAEVITNDLSIPPGDVYALYFTSEILFAVWLQVILHLNGGCRLIVQSHDDL